MTSVTPGLHLQPAGYIFIGVGLAGSCQRQSRQRELSLRHIPFNPQSRRLAKVPLGSNRSNCRDQLSSSFLAAISRLALSSVCLP